jgi:hypothetical protein
MSRDAKVFSLDKWQVSFARRASSLKPRLILGTVAGENNTGNLFIIEKTGFPTSRAPHGLASNVRTNLCLAYLRGEYWRKSGNLQKFVVLFAFPWYA